MKRLMFLCLGIMMLSFFSCERENIQEMSQSPELSAKKLPPVFSAPCSSAFLISGLSSGAQCTITNLNTGQVAATFGNGTSYPTLETNGTYFVSIDGFNDATFNWCSCGNNIGSSTIPAGGFIIFNTSFSSSPYTICSF